MPNVKVPKNEHDAMSDSIAQGVKSVMANKNISGCLVFVTIRVDTGGCYYATGLSGELPEVGETLSMLAKDYREILRRGEVAKKELTKR